MLDLASCLKGYDDLCLPSKQEDSGFRMMTIKQKLQSKLTLHSPITLNVN